MDRAPIGISYGYRIPKDERGLNKRGSRTIDPAEARIIVEIFKMFVSGQSPHAIARILNEKGVPGKDGRPWTDSIVRGHPQRGSGILRNELYVGRLVWNRQHFVKSPKVGRKVVRVNPQADWVISEIPSLRIVPQDLWDQAQARLLDLSNGPAAQRARESRFWIKRPPKHLLDGLIKCAACGRSLVPTRAGQGRRISCTAGRGKRKCASPTSLTLELLEQVILEMIRNRLLTESTGKRFRDLQAKRKRARERARITRTALRREHASISRHLANLIAAIADGIRAPELRQRVDHLSRRKAEIEASLSKLESELQELDSGAAQTHRQKTVALGNAFTSPQSGDAAISILRDLIETVVVRRREDFVDVELFGQIADVLMASLDSEDVEPQHKQRAVKLRSGTWLLHSTGE